MPDQTSEQAQAELAARIKGFNEELLALQKKYKLSLASQVGFTDDGRVGSRVIVADNLKAPEAGATDEKKEGAIEAAE